MPDVLQTGRPAIITGISFLVLYYLSDSAYAAWAPGVPDHGKVEVPVMPVVMWHWGAAYNRSTLKTLWFLGCMTYIAPIAFGLWCARTREETRLLLAAVSVILLFSFQRIFTWALAECRLHSILESSQLEPGAVANLFGAGAVHILTATVAGLCIGAIIRRKKPGRFRVQ